MDIITRISKAMEGSKSKKLTVRDEVIITKELAIYQLWETPIIVKDKTDGKTYVNLSSNMDEGNYYRYGRTSYSSISHTTKNRITRLTATCLTQYNWRLYEGYPQTKEEKDRPLETDCWYEVTENGLVQLQPQLRIGGMIL